MEKPSQSPLETYSSDFKQDVERIGMEKLLEGSHVKGGFEDWELGRRFLAKSIDRDGRILDIGCANGFLLRCFQEWSGKKLEPYGIDVNENMIKQARELFPDKQNHFSLNEEAKKQMETGEFPKEFDLVFWNVWDDLDFASDKGRNMLEATLAITSVGGRAILGFYDKKEKDILMKIDQLAALGHDVRNLKWSPTREEAALNIDKADK